MTAKPPRGMVFNRVPTGEMAGILRVWAKAFVDDLIFRGRSDVRREAGTEIIQGLEPLLTNWRLGRRARRRFTQEWAKSFVGFRHEIATNPVLISAGEKHARRGLFGPLMNRFAMGGRRLPYVYVPDGFWDLTAAEAWEEAEFKQWITDEVYQELRTSFLWTSGQVPVAIVDRRVFWLLLDVFETGRWSDRPEWERWVPFAGRARRRFAQSLRRVARKRWLEPGWAGFWEQWLVLQAAKRLSPDDVRRERRALRLIRTMPIFRAEIAETLAPNVGWIKPKRGTVKTYDSNWYRKIPPILKADYKLRDLDGVEEDYTDPLGAWDTLKGRLAAVWRTFIDPRKWWTAIKRGLRAVFDAIRRPGQLFRAIRRGVVRGWHWLSDQTRALVSRLRQRRGVKGAIKGKASAQAGPGQTPGMPRPKEQG